MRTTVLLAAAALALAACSSSESEEVGGGTAAFREVHWTTIATKTASSPLIDSHPIVKYVRTSPNGLTYLSGWDYGAITVVRDTNLTSVPIVDPWAGASLGPVVADGRALFVGGYDKVWTAEPDGKNVREIHHGGGRWFLALEDAAVYWTTDDETSLSVERFDRAAGTVRKIATLPISGIGCHASALAVDRDDFFVPVMCNEGSKIYRIARTTGDTEILWESTQQIYRAFLDGTVLYFDTFHDTRLLRLTKKGGRWAPDFPVELRGAGVADYAADAQNVYVAEHTSADQTTLRFFSKPAWVAREAKLSPGESVRDLSAGNGFLYVLRQDVSTKAGATAPVSLIRAPIAGL